MNKKKLIIIGASGFGKEVLFLANRLNIKVIGFLDDTIEKKGLKINGVPIVGEIKDWINYSEYEFVIAVGSPSSRNKIYNEMIKKGTPKFSTLIDPSAIIGIDVEIGEGSIICAGVICTTNIKIKNHTIINLNTTIGHDTTIDSFCTIAPTVCISGNIIIEHGVEVGTGAKIREKIVLEKNSLIGMGSVVIKNVNNNEIVIGNPAKPLNIKK